jgi:hypothetical protein
VKNPGKTRRGGGVMFFVLNEIGWVRLVKMCFWVFGGGGAWLRLGGWVAGIWVVRMNNFPFC